MILYLSHINPNFSISSIDDRLLYTSSGKKRHQPLYINDFVTYTLPCTRPYIIYHPYLRLFINIENISLYDLISPYNSIILTDYMAKGKQLPYEVSPLRDSVL